MQINKKCYEAAEKKLRETFKNSDRSNLIMALYFIQKAEEAAQKRGEDEQTISVIHSVAMVVSAAKFHG